MDTAQLQLFQTFEDIRQEKDGIEFWFARDLQKVLGYTQWRNFENTIHKAKGSLITSLWGKEGFADASKTQKNALNSVESHFFIIERTQKSINQYGEIDIERDDIALSRYACYLIAINGSTTKPEIAFAQKYFITKARSYEVLEVKMAEMERLSEREKQSYAEKEFHRIAFTRWVDDVGIRRIISAWDRILFGGNNTQDMKDRYHVTDPKRPLADFLPTVLINAKGLATGITNINTENKNLEWVHAIGTEHMQNNDAVRKLLKERGIIPENLPPAEDIREITKRHKEEQKLLKKSTQQKIQKSS